MPRRRQDGNRQNPQLSPAPGIRPGPLKRDTFERAATPVVDHSGSQGLIQALGIAKQVVPGVLSAVGKMHAEGKANAEKEQREKDTTRWNHYLSTTEQTKQLEDIRAGKAPYYADPYVQGLVEKHHGSLEARKLSNDIDKEISNGSIPFGTLQFSPERYILDKAKPYADSMAKSKNSMYAFRRSLDSIRKEVTAKHQEALGLAQTRKIEDASADVLNQAVTSGFANPNMNGQQIMGQLRKGVYPDLGPRQKGGSAHLKYSRLDELLLDTLKEHAENPKHAAKVIGMLNAQRFELGGNGKTAMGPLSSIHRHRGLIDGIRTTALRTLGQSFREQTGQQLLEKDVAALDNSTGIAFGPVKVDNPYPNQAAYSISSKQRKDAALEFITKRERLASGSSQPTGKEIDLYVANGHEHPMADSLDGAVKGFLTMHLEGPPKTDEDKATAGDRLNKIAGMAASYQYLVDKHPAAKDWFEKDTNTFFSAYTLALRSGKASSPQEAAAIARQVYDNKDGFNLSIANSQLDEAASNLTTQGVDYYGYWFDNSIKDSQIPRRHLKELAILNMRAGGMNAKDALESAKATISKNAVNVNGHLILGQTGLTPQDKPHFQTVLKGFFTKHQKELTDLMDVDDASELSVRARGNGQFVIIRSSDGFPVLFTNRSQGLDEDGVPNEGESFQQTTGIITYRHILGLRATAREKEMNKEIRKVMKNREPPKPQPEPPTGRGNK